MFACRDPTLTKLAISAPQWLQTELHSWCNFHCTVCTDRFSQGSRLKHLFTNVRGVLIIYCTRRHAILNLYFSFENFCFMFSRMFILLFSKWWPGVVKHCPPPPPPKFTVYRKVSSESIHEICVCVCVTDIIFPSTIAHKSLCNLDVCIYNSAY